MSLTTSPCVEAGHAHNSQAMAHSQAQLVRKKVKKKMEKEENSASPANNETTTGWRGRTPSSLLIPPLPSHAAR